MELNQDIFFSTRLPGFYDAIYYPKGGDPIETVVGIDRDIETFPGGFESGVIEKRTEIRCRYDHIGHTNEGDRIAVGDETFTVEEEISNDTFEIRVAVKIDG